jgi:hypothetical protein
LEKKCLVFSLLAGTLRLPFLSACPMYVCFNNASACGGHAPGCHPESCRVAKIAKEEEEEESPVTDGDSYVNPAKFPKRRDFTEKVKPLMRRSHSLTLLRKQPPTSS